MNYLGHSVISMPNKELTIGNFIANGVKGPRPSGHSETIIQGVWLHRHIDVTTDEHPWVKELRAIIRPLADKMAGPVLDVYLDHLLSKYWSRFSEESLKAYTQRVYGYVMEYKALPTALHPFFSYMSQQDWLWHYQDNTTFIRACNGMASRIGFEKDMTDACELLLESDDVFLNDMLSFMQDIKASCKRFL